MRASSSCTQKQCRHYTSEEIHKKVFWCTNLVYMYRNSNGESHQRSQLLQYHHNSYYYTHYTGSLRQKNTNNRGWLKIKITTVSAAVRYCDYMTIAVCASNTLFEPHAYNHNCASTSILYYICVCECV